MENALLYYHVLKGLGFDVYTVGARTRERDSGGVPGGDFPGWVHIVNIVTLPTATTTSADGTVLQKYQRYHVDIAFGGDGALFPMPLTPGLVHANLGTQQIRLVKEYISTQTHRPDHHDGGDPDRHKLWVYQYRNSPQAEWNSYYCFAETEFMQMDWEVVNWWTSTSERSLQTHRPLCILFLRRPNRGTNGAQQEQARGEDVDGVGDAAGDNSSADTGDFHIYGKRMLVAGVVKENLGGKTRILATCETEVQRVAALKEYFDITLTDEEIGGIRGFRSELMQHDPAS
ncbi:N-hydroxyarylamine O-acetyltransferase [Microdochium nivale]|nr:N-hydroxyarylamine O-acetyltransferase [Microdochium nivale]